MYVCVLLYSYKCLVESVAAALLNPKSGVYLLVFVACVCNLISSNLIIERLCNHKYTQAYTHKHIHTLTTISLFPSSYMVTVIRICHLWL